MKLLSINSRKDDQEEMKELKEEGVYASMQELDNPFEGKATKIV